jgi:signal transduction histidine kinase
MTLKTYRVQLLSAALLVATMLLMWFGYRAASKWQTSSELLVEQRTTEVMTLMITALRRDMRGVQSEVLPQMDPADGRSEAFELRDQIATAFARFPYPESFFSWKVNDAGSGSLYVFNRADRPPPWCQEEDLKPAGFPAMVLNNPPEFESVMDQIRRQASLHTRFILFETKIGGETYQVIARAVYHPTSHSALQSIIGFTVNMNWVRGHYFSEMVGQLSRIVEGHSGPILEILDENGGTVTANANASVVPATNRSALREEKFPLQFFDPVLGVAAPHETLPMRYWTARVRPIQDEFMLAAANGERRTFMLISIAAAAVVVGLIFTVRAARSAAALATMKSEFVSAVTHELKTPISSIRIASETLAQGRFSAPDTVRYYATLLLGEVSRLNRTVDNLLTISRLQDIDCFYTFESVDPGTLLEDALNGFQTALQEKGFEVKVDIPAPLPAVYADRTAILLSLDNLIDNAIRYSNGTRRLNVSASVSGAQACLRIADSGPGIASDDIPRVFEKFFRGRNAVSGGSGLGLAIVRRVVKDHHGDVKLQSSPGSGTVAEIMLPLARMESHS